jgi:hypothetical protein
MEGPTEFVKQGYVEVKKSNFGWRFIRRWALLKENTLTFHRNEVI